MKSRINLSIKDLNGKEIYFRVYSTHKHLAGDEFDFVMVDQGYYKQHYEAQKEKGNTKIVVIDHSYMEDSSVQCINILLAFSKDKRFKTGMK